MKLLANAVLLGRVSNDSDHADDLPVTDARENLEDSISQDAACRQARQAFHGRVPVQAPEVSVAGPGPIEARVGQLLERSGLPASGKRSAVSHSTQSDSP